MPHGLYTLKRVATRTELFIRHSLAGRIDEKSPAFLHLRNQFINWARLAGGSKIPPKRDCEGIFGAMDYDFKVLIQAKIGVSEDPRELELL